MWREAYWDMFWRSGMPEAWMMTRMTGEYLMPPAPLRHLPPEAREMEANRGEITAGTPISRPEPTD